MLDILTLKKKVWIFQRLKFIFGRVILQENLDQLRKNKWEHWGILNLCRLRGLHGTDTNLWLQENKAVKYRLFYCFIAKWSQSGVLPPTSTPPFLSFLPSFPPCFSVTLFSTQPTHEPLHPLTGLTASHHSGYVSKFIPLEGIPWHLMSGLLGGVPSYMLPPDEVYFMML